MQQMKDIHLSQLRRREMDTPAYEAEKSIHRGLAGKLLWLGKGVLRPTVFASPMMQQKLSCQKAAHLVEANHIVRDIKKLEA